MHRVDPLSGGFGKKVQEVLFVPEHELEKADKTRVALVCIFLCNYELVNSAHLSSSYPGTSDMALMLLKFLPEGMHSYLSCKRIMSMQLLLLIIADANPLFRGTNSICMYAVDRTTGQLTLLSDNKSPREHDGPRHVAVSPDGNVLYSVTEHSKFQFLMCALHDVLIPSNFSLLCSKLYRRL